MNPDQMEDWETVKLAMFRVKKKKVSAMAASVQQTLDGWTLDMQEDRVFRCRAVIA